MLATATTDKVAKCLIQTGLEAEKTAYEAFNFIPTTTVTIAPVLTGWGALTSWDPPTDFSAFKPCVSNVAEYTAKVAELNLNDPISISTFSACTGVPIQPLTVSVPDYSSYTTVYNTAKTALETLQTEIQGIPTQVTQLEAVRDAALTEADRL